MKTMQLHIFVALLLTILLFVPQVVFAHLVWINAADYTPTFRERFGAGTKIYFGYGHKYPVHDFIKAERLTEFTCTDPENKKIDIKPGAGDFLDLKVLFKGKPARYFKVYTTYSGFSTDNNFAYTTGTDAKGMARIRILHYGPWLIKAGIKMPAPDELKGACRQVHYTATLTFGIK
ncbi:MAG: DUF4198 domain-containing protein [Desulfosarcina sp.]|nr:DUF4198 domain-containing protein [Desulfobacterales bacterium]